MTSLLRLADVAPTHRLGDFAAAVAVFWCIAGQRTVAQQGKPSVSSLRQNGRGWPGPMSYCTDLPLTAHYIGNALQVCSAAGALASETFDRIVMNPGFW